MMQKAAVETSGATSAALPTRRSNDSAKQVTQSIACTIQTASTCVVTKYKQLKGN
jgi:hypothetical protein